MSDHGDHNDIYKQLGILTGRVSSVEGGIGRIESKLDTTIDQQQQAALAAAGFKGRVIGVASVVSIFTGAAASWAWNKLTGS